MSAPFTAGPWATGGKHRTTAIDAPGVEVAFARQDHGRIDSTTAEANARLIAAAPELLEALQAQVARCFDPECPLCTKHEALIAKVSA